MLYYHTHHTNVNIKEAINWFCRWKKKCLVYNILKLLIYTHRLYNIIYYPIFFLDESCCRTLYIYKVDFFFSHFPINHTRASRRNRKIFRMYVVGSWEYVVVGRRVLEYKISLSRCEANGISMLAGWLISALSALFSTSYFL